MAKRQRHDTAQEKAAVRTDDKQLYDRTSVMIRGRELRIGHFIVSAEGYTKARRVVIIDPDTGDEHTIVEPPRKVLKVDRVDTLVWSRKGQRCTVNGKWVYDVAGEVLVAQ